MTNEEFKKIVKEKFNNLTYDGEFESIRKTPRLIFHCNKEDHDIPFSIRTDRILRKECTVACPFCNGQFNDKLARKRLKELFGDNIELLSTWEFGKTSSLNSVLEFKCKKHGIFKEKFNNVIRYNCGCSKCSYEKANREKNKKSINDLKIKLERYNITFNEEEFKNVLTPLNFYRDGKFLYKRSPSKILYENHILPKQSTGEEYITLLLETNNIEFESQKTFNDLFDKGPLKFDFFIAPNIFIEFNGSQHKNGDSLFYSETTVLHDNMKVDYVTNNNYNMLIIEKENNHSLTKKEREMIQKKVIDFIGSPTTIEILRVK